MRLPAASLYDLGQADRQRGIDLRDLKMKVRI